jgi:hypothetical protein
MFSQKFFVNSLSGDALVNVRCAKSQAAASGRGRVKTQKYSVFGCRFTVPELLPSQYGAI